MAKMTIKVMRRLYATSPALMEFLKRTPQPGDLPATHTIEGKPLKPEPDIPVTRDEVG